ELGRLASDYSAAINKYLGQARKKRGLIQRLLPTEPDPNGREQTVLRLDELDRRRLGSKDKTLARKE
ncbi:MAG TPA: hypothetical protein VHH88_08965, partial [Verrucomicrobiae bacterium]|nr:hypothetical protein [Verrucomicrobiae bacterium]